MAKSDARDAHEQAAEEDDANPSPVSRCAAAYCARAHDGILFENHASLVSTDGRWQALDD